jgi:hypothetical protein
MLTLTANRNWRILEKRWCAYWICSCKLVLLETRGIQYMCNVCNAPTRNILYSTIYVLQFYIHTYTMCDHFPSLCTLSCSLVHNYSVLLVSYVLFVLCTQKENPRATFDWNLTSAGDSGVTAGKAITVTASDRNYELQKFAILYWIFFHIFLNNFWKIFEQRKSNFLFRILILPPVGLFCPGRPPQSPHPSCAVSR